MQRFVWVFALIIGLAFVLTGCATQEGRSEAQAEAGTQEQAAHSEGHGDGEAELALYMSQLQRWLHKSALSVEARNPALTDFYLHELEETVATIQEEAPTYEGYAIKSLSDQILMPTIEALEDALADQDWSGADARLGEVTNACNQCHAATDHGFIQIQTDDLANPYAQSFEPQEAAN